MRLAAGYRAPPPSPRPRPRLGVDRRARDPVARARGLPAVRWSSDGYNVIRRDPDLRAHEAESLEAGRKALLRVLAQARGAAGDQFAVVFDGARVSGGEPSEGRIRTIFSRPPRTAD